MSSSKLDAKHERTLKALLKLPDNRRCAVCESLVSGLHRVLAGRVCKQAWLAHAHTALLHAARRARSMSSPTLVRSCAPTAAASSAPCPLVLAALCVPAALHLLRSRQLTQGACWVFAAGSSITAARALRWPHLSRRRCGRSRKVATLCVRSASEAPVHVGLLAARCAAVAWSVLTTQKPSAC